MREVRKGNDRLGVMDIVGLSAQQNICVVFPTHDHAIDYWPRIKQAIIDRHGRSHVKPTKTAIYMALTKKTLRLWVPFQRSPTQVMDFWQERRKFMLVSPYDRTEFPSWVRT